MRTFAVDLAPAGEGRPAKPVASEILTFEPEDVLVETTSVEGYACAEEGGRLVGLDTTLTEALEREGLARERVCTVQGARKQAGLEVSDRITSCIDVSAGGVAALDAYRGYVMEETLATGWGGRTGRPRTRSSTPSAPNGGRSGSHGWKGGE